MDCYEFRYALRLLSPGRDRLKTMAVLRSVRTDLSLVEAKAMIDATPTLIMTDIASTARDDLIRRFNRIADVEMIDDPL